jgi:hypothetical protein
VPTVTYIGKQDRRRNNDASMPDWVRGIPQEVSDDWVARNGNRLSADFVIAGAHEDLGSDGIPDSAWTKAKITEWLTGQGVHVGGGFKTKMTLLDMVEGVLNPTPVAEPVVEEAPVEEAPVEEPAEEVVETIGDDE